MFKKDYIFLILLLVLIAGAFLWKDPELVSKLASNLFSSPELNLAEDAGLDLDEINLEETEIETEIEEEEEDGIGGPLIGELLEEETLEQEVVVLKKKLTLEEIQQEINIIAKEVERIDKQVQILVALHKTQ